MKTLVDILPKVIVNNAEIIGTAASVLVLISFLMKEIKVIRIISIVGCIFFVFYGLLIGALTIWILNGILILVHIFFLIRLRKSKSKQRKQEQRLGKFTRTSFNKKGLRDLPWFIGSDSD